MSPNNLTYLKSIATRLELNGDTLGQVAMASAILEISMLRRALADSMDGLITEKDLGDKLNTVLNNVRQDRGLGRSKR